MLLSSLVRLPGLVFGPPFEGLVFLRVPDSVYKWECKVFSVEGPLLLRTRCSVSGVTGISSAAGVEYLEGPWNILIPPVPFSLDPRRINVEIGGNELEVVSLTPVRTGVKLIARGVLTSPLVPYLASPGSLPTGPPSSPAAVLSGGVTLIHLPSMLSVPTRLIQVEVPKVRWTIDNFPASTVQVGSPTVYQITPVGLTTQNDQSQTSHHG